METGLSTLDCWIFWTILEWMCLTTCHFRKKHQAGGWGVGEERGEDFLTRDFCFQTDLSGATICSQTVEGAVTYNEASGRISGWLTPQNSSWRLLYSAHRPANWAQKIPFTWYAVLCGTAKGPSPWSHPTPFWATSGHGDLSREEDIWSLYPSLGNCLMGISIPIT